MIRHAMTYVQRAQKVRAELGPEHPLVADLTDAEEMLVAAETQLVAAYRLWRALMKEASPASPSAIRYLEESTWDLT